MCLWILHLLQLLTASPLIMRSPPAPVGRERTKKSHPHLAKLGLQQGPAVSAAFSSSTIQHIIDAQVQGSSRMPGCVLLSVDTSASTDHTVYTFMRSTKAIVKGALSAAHIDLSWYTGELGAVQTMIWCRALVGSGCSCTAGAKVSCWWPSMACCCI